MSRHYRWGTSLFASYDSPSYEAVENTPVLLNDSQQIISVDHEDGLLPIELHSTTAEFRNYISAQYCSSLFDQSFLDAIFDRKAGHVENNNRLADNRFCA
jgi:hypothetical protein